eukprot:2944459-Rhodomonas_salina.2
MQLLMMLVASSTRAVVTHAPKKLEQLYYIVLAGSGGVGSGCGWAAAGCWGFGFGKGAGRGER